jgi:hypothetical protein
MYPAAGRKLPVFPVDLLTRDHLLGWRQAAQPANRPLRGATHKIAAC